MLNDAASLASHLATRRSAKPRNLGAPGPDAAQLDAMIAVAARTPDHGKLAPWRFVVIDSRDAFAALLARAYAADGRQEPMRELDPAIAVAHDAPVLVAVVSKPDPASRIPLWEQRLSAGAACMNLLHAAHARHFVGGWVTGWAAYSRIVAAALGATGVEDRIAGFIHIGTPTCVLDERPRPLVDVVRTRWSG